MIFKVDYNIFERFPEVLLGVIVAKGIDNSGISQDVLDLLKSEEQTISAKIGQTIISEYPKISSWREAYRKFGTKPKDNPSSIENLVRRVVKGESVRHINKLVDIYNLISLKYLVPVGGEDLGKISGDIWLTFAKENELPILLLGEKEPRSPHVSEVIYKDNNGAICRRWNWKEADRTKLTEQTKNCILVIEALPPVDEQELKQATDELASLVKKYCGGELTTHILNKENSEISLE